MLLYNAIDKLSLYLVTSSTELLVTVLVIVKTENTNGAETKGHVLHSTTTSHGAAANNSRILVCVNVLQWCTLNC